VTVYTDSATVLVDITPSGVEFKTGSGTDSATVRVSLTTYGYEGDFAISAPTGIIQPADSTPAPVPPPSPGEEQPEPVKKGTFIGQGLLRHNFHANQAFNRFVGVETNRFTGELTWVLRSPQDQ
jgi:hypothetical protein